MATSVVVLAGCGEAPEKFGEWAWGDVLRGRVTALERLPDALIMAEDGETFKRVTPEEGKELVVAYVELANDEASKVLMSIGTQSAELDERTTSRESHPVDSFARGVETEEFGEDETYYWPLLWGNVELNKGFQIAGWMIFEAEEGSKFRRMVWRESDTIFISFE
jgi:hypothetical protein